MNKKSLLMVMAIVCSLLLLTTSCAKKQVGTGAETTPPVKTETKKPEQPTKEPVVDKAVQLQQEIDSFQAGIVYFDFDKSNLKSEYQNLLNVRANWLKKHPEFSVRVEGHCDERGTAEYNLALGERRADTVKNYMESQGISADRLRIISYGEEDPVDPGHNEDAWALNRRAQFKLFR